MRHGMPKGVYGVAVREPYPSESDYFRKNPKVTGMAAEDNRIILNPYSTLSEAERQSVLVNEAARVHMRTGLMKAPRYEMSPEQLKAFSGYGDNNLDAIRQTFAARLLTGDPTAISPSPEQAAYAAELRKFMGVK